MVKPYSGAISALECGRAFYIFPLYLRTSFNSRPYAASNDNNIGEKWIGRNKEGKCDII